MKYYANKYVFLFLLITFVVSLLVDYVTARVFKKYSIACEYEGTAVELARSLLTLNDIFYVRVEYINGTLTDCYDSKNKIIFLSDQVYSCKTVSAFTIASHETAHAIQEHDEYFFFNLREKSYGVVSILTKILLPIFIFGLILHKTSVYFSLAGIIICAIILMFNIITLPVEINASRMAVEMLEKEKVLTENEMKYAKKVLMVAIIGYILNIFNVNKFISSMKEKL